MNIFVRTLLAVIVGLGAAAGETSAQSPIARRTGPQEMPADPGIPIGCLLSPSCGPKLFTHPDGRIVAPQAPVDPGNGVPCLVDAKNCGNLLSVGGRQALFKRAVTPQDVATAGAKVGDYIPASPPPPLAPPSGGFEAIAASWCTASIVDAKESALRAQQSQNDQAMRGLKVGVAVNAYTNAVAACQPLRR